jgi:hypothetical protein
LLKPMPRHKSQYPPAATIAPKLREHFERHIASARLDGAQALAPLPDLQAIEAVIDAAFWASVRREEGYTPRISLAYVSPTAAGRPLMFAKPIALAPEALARLAPAVERPGIHLGVCPDDGKLSVWGMTRVIPAFCFVVEVSGPGILVVKHRRREESGKFVNVAVLEGNQIKLLDDRAISIPDCPPLVSALLGYETPSVEDESVNVLAALAVSIRQHGRGGSLLVVPEGSGEWRESVVRPLPYAISPHFAELAKLMNENAAARREPWWNDVFRRMIDTVAGLTAVDGATLLTDRYELLAFGAKIARREGRARVEQVMLTEPIEGGHPVSANTSQIGGTRHLSAAQFVHDQRDAIALVASQDGRFTIFAWSPVEECVYAYRTEALLL